LVGGAGHCHQVESLKGVGLYQLIAGGPPGATSIPLLMAFDSCRLPDCNDRPSSLFVVAIKRLRPLNAIEI
jgi:hypothetical protein